MNLLDPSQLPSGASDGPETWGEAFGRLATASDETQRVVENVVADDAARYDAYAGYIKEVQDATGVQITNPLDVDLRQGAFEAKPNPNISGGTGLEWREQKMQASLDQFEAARQKVAAQYPAQFNLIPLDIDGRMRRQMKAASVEQGRAAQSPELGTVGRFSAQLLGGLKGTARDPYQWAMAVTGGGGSATGSVAARIGKTMLTEALINGGQELVLQGASQERKRAAGLEHGLNDMLKNAGIAATFGALFGGTIEGGGAIARAYGLGEESAARASRILDGNPQRGDVEAMAADLGITLTEEQKSQIGRSFEERVLDEHMLPADAAPDQVRVFEAAKNYAEDPDNFPEPELVERAIADEQSGARSLTADDYERLYSGGDPDAIDDIRDTFFADDQPASATNRPSRADGTSYEIGGGQLPEKGVVVANINSDGRVYIGNPGDVHFSLADRYAGSEHGSPEFTGFINPDGRIMGRQEAFRWVAENEKPVRPSENMGETLDALDYREQVPDRLKKGADTATAQVVDELDGQRIRPDRALEPADDAAIRAAEELAGDIVEPRIDANGNPETLLDFVPLQDSDGNIRLVSVREALEAADEENFFADVLEACKV